MKHCRISVNYNTGLLAGDGLGFLWPYLAGYPQNKIAIVDLACVMKPFSQDVQPLAESDVLVRVSV